MRAIFITMAVFLFPVNHIFMIFYHCLSLDIFADIKSMIPQNQPSCRNNHVVVNLGTAILMLQIHIWSPNFGVCTILYIHTIAILGSKYWSSSTSTSVQIKTKKQINSMKRMQLNATNPTTFMSKQQSTTQYVLPTSPDVLVINEIVKLKICLLKLSDTFINTFSGLLGCFWHPCICMHCGIASRLIKTAPTPFSALGKFGKSLSGEIFNQIETNMAIIGFQTKPEQYHNMATIHEVQIGRKSL